MGDLHQIFREGQIQSMMNASRALGRPCRQVNSSRRGKDPNHLKARRSSQDDSPQLFELLSDPVRHRRAHAANARKNMQLAPVVANISGCRQRICATHLPLYSLSYDHCVLSIAAVDVHRARFGLPSQNLKDDVWAKIR